MKNLVRKNILGVKPYTPGKPIEEVERELGIRGVVKMASNENCFGPSPKAMAAMRKAIPGVNRYPDASCFYLKSRLAKALGVSETMITVGNGSDEVIVLAIRTLVNEGEEVIIARPTFLIYEIASQISNAAMRFIPAMRDFRHDLKAMKKAITPSTKMVFIANPDNPTGTYVSKRELDEFFDGLPASVVVLLDEAYFEFARSGFRDYPDGTGYLSRPNVMVLRSFSKAYGLAGLRVGYGIGNPELISYMERVRDPFNVNLMAQKAALAALDDKAFLKKTLAHTEREKEAFYNAFKKMRLKYVPSATNFMLVDVERDCQDVFGALLKRGVIVRDMKAWGLDSYIRVTIGTRAENRKFLKALREVLK
ncbi:MAG: histidinol-phosphate transaminase [Candidatus Omnitrophica bacterium]|nr:histidinol-phosphate transaminase [Candidatus Omnitrophota bacterium]